LNLRLFLDANILFTAAYSPGGLSGLLFELCRRGIIQLLTSEHAAEEARINLELKQTAALSALESRLKLVQVVHTPAKCPIPLNLPEDDLTIFAAALSCRATHFITGDKKHFARYFEKPDQTGGIRIQTVRQFFDDRF
jgi:predicted nucleic acid-binding protein